MSSSEDNSGECTPKEPDTADSSKSVTSSTRLSLVAERLRELKEKRDSARRENIAEVISYVYHTHAITPLLLPLILVHTHMPLFSPLRLSYIITDVPPEICQ